MRALSRLFGRSPFATLGIHMEKVAECTRCLPHLFETIKNKQFDEAEQIVTRISKLEHEADLIKNDIRTSLKSHLFLPVARVSLLEVLALQDSLADKAEDIAVLTSFKRLEVPATIDEVFHAFLAKNMECFEGICQVITELNELLESSFGGGEADRIRAGVDMVAYTEHEIDLIQRGLLRTLYNSEDTLSYTAFHLWDKLTHEIAGISNLSEKLGNRILMTMELK